MNQKRVNPFTFSIVSCGGAVGSDISVVSCGVCAAVTCFTPGARWDFGIVHLIFIANFLLFWLESKRNCNDLKFSLIFFVLLFYHLRNQQKTNLLNNSHLRDVIVRVDVVVIVHEKRDGKFALAFSAANLTSVGTAVTLRHSLGDLEDASGTLADEFDTIAAFESLKFF